MLPAYYGLVRLWEWYCWQQDLHHCITTPQTTHKPSNTQVYLMQVPAPHIPVGRRPQWIQSFFILCTSRRAVSSTLRVFSPNWRLCANRWMYRHGSTPSTDKDHLHCWQTDKGLLHKDLHHQQKSKKSKDLCHKDLHCWQPARQGLHHYIINRRARISTINRQARIYDARILIIDSQWSTLVADRQTDK